MSRMEFNELSSCEVRRLNQFRTADRIRIGSAIFPPGSAGNNGCGPALIQTPYFPLAELNAEIITNLQFSSVIICFSVLISVELSSASESIQPGLIIWVGLNSNSFRLM